MSETAIMITVVVVIICHMISGPGFSEKLAIRTAHVRILSIYLPWTSAIVKGNG
jgi:hypothetical protein